MEVYGDVQLDNKNHDEYVYKYVDDGYEYYYIRELKDGQMDGIYKSLEMIWKVELG